MEWAVGIFIAIILMFGIGTELTSMNEVLKEILQELKELNGKGRTPKGPHG